MSWMNLILLLILIIGHAELCVTFINRSHSFKIHQGSLVLTRHFIDLFIVAMPFLILILPGWKDPGLLTVGKWTELNSFWKFYFSLCGFGSLGFLFAVMRWNFYQVPSIQKQKHTVMIDISHELNKRPINKGHYHWMSFFPGNQIFEVEFSEQLYELPVPLKDKEELTILHLTDFHYTGVMDLSFYKKVLEHAQDMQADIIFFTGDLIDDPNLNSWIPETLGKLKAPLGCYYILGNHDWYDEPEKPRKILSECGWIDVSSKAIKVPLGESHLELGGLELPWMGTYPEFDTGKENRFRILLSHSPDNFPWAQSQQVDLMLSGHNHGGQVVLPVIGPVFAPSLFGVRFASGVFYQSGTLMSVLRGLSGVHPLRLNCRPEIVKYKIVSSLRTQIEDNKD